MPLIKALHSCQHSGADIAVNRAYSPKQVFADPFTVNKKPAFTIQNTYASLSK